MTEDERKQFDEDTARLLELIEHCKVCPVYTHCSICLLVRDFKSALMNCIWTAKQYEPPKRSRRGKKVVDSDGAP